MAHQTDLGASDRLTSDRLQRDENIAPVWYKNEPLWKCDDESYFFAQLTTADYLWIGITDKDNEGDWKQLNGQPAPYLAWNFQNTNEPDGLTNENYADMVAANRNWRDVSEYENDGFTPGPIHATFPVFRTFRFRWNIVWIR